MRRPGRDLVYRVGPAILSDEQATTRAAIGQLIHTQHHMDVLEADSATEAVALAQSHNPALVLMELLMPGLDSFSAATEIKRLRPYAKIAILTRKDDPAYALQARERKLDGFILKKDSPEELSYAIRRILAGGFL